MSAEHIAPPRLKPVLPMVAGRYYVPLIGTLSTSNTLGVGTFRASPIYIPNAVTVKSLAVDISAAGEAGSKVRLGIYADDGTGRPGSLVVDAGQVAGDAIAVPEITGLSVGLRPGWYWQGVAVQNVVTTQPTLRSVVGPMPGNPDYGTSLPSANQVLIGMAMSSVTGALPSTFSTPSPVGSVARLIFGL